MIYLPNQIETLITGVQNILKYGSNFIPVLSHILLIADSSQMCPVLSWVSSILLTSSGMTLPHIATCVRMLVHLKVY